MRRPGERRREQDRKQRIDGDQAEQHPERGAFSYGVDQADELVQRHEHEAEADRDAPEVARAGRAAPAEHQDAGQHQDRRRLGDVEGQQLHDQRGADIGAEHGRERGDQIDQARRREG